jgi:hypothetical protein
MRIGGRLIGVLAASLAFGVTVSVVKGNGAGVREAVGNTSAPWLVLAFLTGAFVAGRRVGRAALVATACSFIALAGFYVANTFVLDLGPHDWLTDVRLTVGAGRLYFALAALSGPVFGALGGLWQHGRSAALAVLVAASLVLEPAAWLAYQHARHLSDANQPAVWAVEVVVGLCACVLAATHGRAQRPLPD